MDYPRMHRFVPPVTYLYLLRPGITMASRSTFNRYTSKLAAPSVPPDHRTYVFWQMLSFDALTRPE